MKTIDSLARLADLRAPVFTTNDAAAALRITRAHASKTLARLAGARQIMRLRRGSWGFRDKIDPLTLPALLTAPAPCYISLQSALYAHGMISQVPQRIYAVSSARTQTMHTPLGTISIHHLKPSFFRGFETDARTGLAMATPEKALADCLYLGLTRSRLFAALPELELPRKFSRARMAEYICRIDAPRRRRAVQRRWAELLKNSFRKQNT